MKIRHRGVRATAGALGAIGLFAGALAPATPAWGAQQDAVDAVPSPRSGFALAYDSRRDQVVLFGGVSGTEDRRSLGDTWVWDGSAWRQLEFDGPAPPPRRYPAMTFDSRRGVMVLFGGWGEGNVALGDTWEFDGQAWTEAQIDEDDDAPPARFLSAMAYDSNRGLTMLFGGRGARRNLLGDMWEWNGQAWRLVEAVGPFARAGHAMVYHEARGTTLIMGGFTRAALNDAWEFDGKMWTQLESSKVPPRHQFAMGYDAENNRVLLFGGAGRGRRLSDMWIWANGFWNQGPPAAPMARSLHQGVYRPGRGFMIFGGITDNFTNPEAYRNDMWLFDGSRWRPQWN